ncbi:hypothetical protein V565_285540, partial [Rhizoctonia solani 123E]
MMEHRLEDARAQAEREDQSAQSRIAKAKEGEQAAWKECLELRKEVDNLNRGVLGRSCYARGYKGDAEGLRAEVAVRLILLYLEELEGAEKTELDLHAVVEGLEKDKTYLEERAAEQHKMWSTCAVIRPVPS